MLISRKHNFLFIHIYKNAGTSITSALMPFAATHLQSLISRAFKKLNIPSLVFDPQPYHDHIKGAELVSAIGKVSFDSYFSFAIVRNPWDWQVSLYKYALTNPKHHQHALVKGFSGFDEYIEWRCKKEVRYQKDFIYSNDDELLVNFVGRYENIDADFKEICSRIGISTSLPKLNVYNTKPYQQYYSNETKELVKKAFQPDINLFGYDF